MCGIIGYTGKEDVLDVLCDGLRALEYRGYDSSGVALLTDGEIKTVKCKGGLDRLLPRLSSLKNVSASCGIGHTRWATHGKPSDTNSHPHYTDSLALVHNGIIENYAELAQMLLCEGYVFHSETDTEVAAKLIDLFYKKCRDPLKAIFSATELMRGSYAFGIIFSDINGAIYSIKKDSPLIVAKGNNGALIASDATAILPYSNQYYRPRDNIAVRLCGEEIEFYSPDLQKTQEVLEHSEASAEAVLKGNAEHFMLKEILEEPLAVERTLLPFLRDGLPCFPTNELYQGIPKEVSQIHVVACGTAMHAGLVGKHFIEALSRTPVSVEIASEFRYRNPILSKNDVVILISQSGETADTLAALRHAKSRGISTLAIVNSVGSAIATEADRILYTCAGHEIAVASTKAYTVQCAILILLAIDLALSKGCIGKQEAKLFCSALLNDIPTSLTDAFYKKEQIKALAEEFTRKADHLFFIGRGVDYAIAVEASLKLKEISYVHSEAYPAGELKHGTISLISDGIPIIAILTDGNICEKTISSIREVKARGARVLVLTTDEISQKHDIPHDKIITFSSPKKGFELFPASAVLQLFAYYAACARGLNVDKPRNLAKSVTVE